MRDRSGRLGFGPHYGRAQPCTARARSRCRRCRLPGARVLLRPGPAASDQPSRTRTQAAAAARLSGSRHVEWRRVREAPGPTRNRDRRARPGGRRLPSLLAS